MKLGLFTSCLPELDLVRVADFAASAGLEALEVAVWPRAGRRPFTASHVDVAGLTQREAGTLRTMLHTKGLPFSCLSDYDNNLHPHPSELTAVNGHVLACIDAAALLGCPLVGTFIGWDPTKTVKENLPEAERILPHSVDLAAQRGVCLVIENCVEGGTMVATRGTWRTHLSSGSGCSHSTCTWTMTLPTCSGLALTPSQLSSPTPTACPTRKQRTSRSSPTAMTDIGTAGKPSTGMTPGMPAGGDPGARARPSRLATRYRYPLQGRVRRSCPYRERGPCTGWHGHQRQGRRRHSDAGALRSASPRDRR